MSFVSYAQNFEDVLLHRVFAGQETGFYVDIGAFHPVDGSVTKAFYDRGWNGINVEPGPVFQELAAARPRDINLRMAVLDRTGEVAFVEDELDRGMSHVVDIGEGNAGASTSVVVPCDTLENILRAHGKGRPVDFLKVDAEGAESAIVHSTDWRRVRPRVMVFEATLPWSSVLSNQAWEPVLLDQGYVRAYFDGINCFYVAEEDEAVLLRHFRVPVNVLDRVERYDPAIPALVAARDAAEAARDTAEAARRAAQDALDTLEAEHRDLRVRHADALAAGVAARQEADRVSGERAVLEREHARLAAEHAALRQAHGALLAAHGRLEGEHGASKADVARLRDELARAQAETARLGLEREAWGVERDRLEAHQERLRADGARAAVERDVLIAERDAVAAQRDELAGSVQRLEARTAELDGLVEGLHWDGGPRAIRTVLPAARVLRRLSWHTRRGPVGLPPAPPAPSGAAAAPADATPGHPAPPPGRRAARAAYTLIRPIARPLAWRIRRILIEEFARNTRHLDERIERLSDQVARGVQEPLMRLQEPLARIEGRVSHEALLDHLLHIRHCTVVELPTQISALLQAVQMSPARSAAEATAETELRRLAQEMEHALLTLAMEPAGVEWRRAPRPFPPLSDPEDGDAGGGDHGRPGARRARL